MNEEWNVNKIVAESIARLVEKNVSNIFSSIKNFVSDELKKGEIEIGSAFDTYLKKAYEKYSKVKTLLYRDSPKFIYDFYEYNYLSVSRDSDDRIDAENISNVLDVSHFIIISGTAGAGKTTTLKHFFIDAIRNTELIPIFVELKELNNSDTPLIDCMYQSMHKLGFPLEQKYFEFALKSGCFIFLFDGYDEVYQNDRIFKEIDSLCDQYGENYFIMTSRPSDDFISWQRFSVLESIPLTKKQACSLIGKIDYNNDVKEIFLKQLSGSLYGRHKSFASNPLLLNIMLLTFESYAEIPDKLHIFYANAFETLFIKHDATKGGYKRGLKCSLASDQFQLALADFCFKSYVKGKIDFTKTELTDILKTTAVLNDSDLNEFIDDLITSVCILYVEGLNYQFTHRSFQEYFSALFIKNLDDAWQTKVCINLLEKDSRALRHDAVFNMLFDMNQERFERNIIIPFLKKSVEQAKASDNRLEDIFKQDFGHIFLDSISSANSNEPPEHFLHFVRNSGNYSASLRTFIFSKYRKFYLSTFDYDQRQQAVVSHILSEKLDVLIVDDLLVSFTWTELSNDKVVSEHFLHEDGELSFIFNTSVQLLNEIEAQHDRMSLDIETLFS